MVAKTIRIETESYYDLNWSFINESWSFNQEMETLLEKKYPFRTVRTKKIDNRYKK